MSVPPSPQPAGYATQPPAKKSRTTILAVAVVVVVVVVAVVLAGLWAVGAIFKSGSSSTGGNTIVDITVVNLNPTSSQTTCWTSMPAPGASVNAGHTFWANWTLSYKGGSSEPASCVAESVSAQTAGFSIASSNTPLTVRAGGVERLTVVLETPTTAYTGAVTLDLAVATPSTPIGTAFVVGNPIASTCQAGGTIATTGCTAGDFMYTLTIEASAVTFGNVLFEVKTPTGSIFVNTGVAGFAIETITGGVAAYSSFAVSAGLAMSTTWAHYEGTTTNATPLTSIYTILIDMGQTGSEVGMGLTFYALGTGQYSGTTSPVVLP